MSNGTLHHSDKILERLLNLHPKRIDLTLDRMWALLDKLGNPQNHLPPVVHIAGTNGKGSTLAFIKAIVEAAGLRVHRYSSPHLVRFHERITLAGQTIPENELASLLAECESVQGDTPITFFEITTAAAFLAFSRCPADLLLLETGLGGRLDATNVVPEPALSILSKIGIDHQDFLGETLGEIAAEKVAIAKSSTPLVVNKQPEAAMQVIQDYMTQHNITGYLSGRDWTFDAQNRQEWQWQSGKEKLTLPPPALFGHHQYENAALAIAAVKILQKQNFAILDTDITTGIQQVEWPGRMQKVPQGRWQKPFGDDVSIWVDGGHNLDAAKVLAKAVATLDEPRLIIGMLGNKDCRGFLGCLAEYLDHAQSLTIPNEASALPAESIAELHPNVSPAQDFESALEYAHNSGGKNIIICGSLYLIGTFLRT